MQIKAVFKPNGPNALLFTLLGLDSSQTDTGKEIQTGGGITDLLSISK